MIEAARANGLDAASIQLSARRSVESLDACLGPTVDGGAELEDALRAAIETALRLIDTQADTTKGTRQYCDHAGAILAGAVAGATAVERLGASLG